MSFVLSKNSKKNREGVHPHLIEISDLAIQITVIDFGHGSSAGVRTAKEQNALFKANKSRADGYNDLSNHQVKPGNEYGMALDFYAFVRGASWEEEHLAMVAAAFLQAASTLGYKIEWGGLWKRRKPKYKNGIAYGWDMPHIQLINDDK